MSARISLSSAPARAEPHRTSDASRGAALPRTDTLAAPLLSPRIHAREARALASDQLGAREETPAPTGPELVPATEARGPRVLPGLDHTSILVLCATCRQSIRHNPVLGISFCPAHGLSQSFVFIPISQRRFPGY